VKFGAHGIICRIAFVISIIDEQEISAALPSITQVATVFQLAAYLSVLPLSPSTLITFIDFFDGQDAIN
jgi:hypothetical protein